MNCGKYKIWKEQNDDDVININNWLKNKDDVKNCPSCKRIVERSTGCDDMHCTNCDARFCWRCLTTKKGYFCETCNPRR